MCHDRTAAYSFTGMRLQEVHHQATQLQQAEVLECVTSVVAAPAAALAAANAEITELREQLRDAMATIEALTAQVEQSREAQRVAEERAECSDATIQDMRREFTEAVAGVVLYRADEFEADAPRPASVSDSSELEEPDWLGAQDLDVAAGACTLRLSTSVSVSASLPRAFLGSAGGAADECERVVERLDSVPECWTDLL